LSCLWWVEGNTLIQGYHIWGVNIDVTNYLKHTKTVAKTEIVVIGEIISNAVVDYQRVLGNAVKPIDYHDSIGY
jgi:hypothetical protein